MIPASISLGCSSCTLFACLKLSYRISIDLTVEKRLYSLVPKHKWGWNRKFWSFLLKNHKFWTFCEFVRLELLPRLNNCIAICSLDCTHFSQKPPWMTCLAKSQGRIHNCCWYVTCQSSKIFEISSPGREDRLLFLYSKICQDWLDKEVTRFHHK